MTQICWVALLVVAISTVPLFSGTDSHDSLRILSGSPIDTDGKIQPGEWDDAQFVEIAVAPDWVVKVGAKYGAEDLNFVFEAVKHGKKRLFPEILLDPKNLKSADWRSGIWWFHISGNLCEGNGEPNVYEKRGVFQCAHIKPGWDGNNPPMPDTDVVEVSVSFKKLGIQPERGASIGIAFDMTDATEDRKQKFFYWPSNASISSPATWGTGVFE
jgi:hypothetical protein